MGSFSPFHGHSCSSICDQRTNHKKVVLVAARAALQFRIHHQHMDVAEIEAVVAFILVVALSGHGEASLSRLAALATTVIDFKKDACEGQTSDIRNLELMLHIVKPRH